MPLLTTEQLDAKINTRPGDRPVSSLLHEGGEMLLNCLLLIQDECVEDEVKVQNSSSSDKSSTTATKQGRYRKRASVDHSGGEAASAAKRKNKPDSRGSQKITGK